MTAYHIYLISAGEGNPVKVGMATNALKRLKQHQVSSFMALNLIGKWKVPYRNIYKMERILHLRLKPQHVRGEWFSCSAEECKAIIEDEMLKTKNGANIPAHISPKPLLSHRSAASMKGGLIGAAKKKSEINERAKGLTKEEWTTGSVRNAHLVKKYGCSINALKRYASDKGWGWNCQQAIWRAEQRKGTKNVKAV